MNLGKTNLKLERNDGGYWEVRWREGGESKRQSLRTKDASAAQSAFATFLLTDTKQASYTVGEAWQLRKIESLPRIVDASRIENAWKRLGPFFAETPISDMTQKLVNEYVAERLDDGVELSTIRRELGELNTTLKAMVDARRVPFDAFPKLTLPSAQAARPTFLTVAQVAHVMAEARERRDGGDHLSRLELFLHIGLETGQRRRAIEKLEWDQVDFPARMIHFRKDGELATKKRKPSVPMSAPLQHVLEMEYEVRSGPYVLRHPGSIRTSFENLMKACGLEAITPHSLRHTFVSQLLMRSKSVYDVAAVVGMTVKMVETTYGHLTPEYLRSVLDTR